jgi:hypothetical protein
MIHVPKYNAGDDYYDFELRSLPGAEATILDAQFHTRAMAVTGGSRGSGEDRDFAGITIDGFTFTNGKATDVEGTDPESWSAGGLSLHLSDTVVRNCIFTGNEADRGGAMWVGSQGDAIIENCLFENNRARDSGGAVFLINSEPRITMRDCTIRNNHAIFKGGGIFAYNVATTLENMLIVGNDSSDKGGGIYFAYLNPDCEMIRCTVAGNDANMGAAFVLEHTPEDREFRSESSIFAFNTGSAPFNLIADSWRISAAPWCSATT